MFLDSLQSKECNGLTIMFFFIFCIHFFCRKSASVIQHKKWSFIANWADGTLLIKLIEKKKQLKNPKKTTFPTLGIPKFWLTIKKIEWKTKSLPIVKMGKMYLHKNQVSPIFKNIQDDWKNFLTLTNSDTT